MLALNPTMFRSATTRFAASISATLETARPKFPSLAKSQTPGHQAVHLMLHVRRASFLLSFLSELLRVALAPRILHCSPAHTSCQC